MTGATPAANRGDKGLVGWFIERVKNICGRDFPVEMGGEEKGERRRELLKEWMGDRDFLRRN